MTTDQDRADADPTAETTDLQPTTKEKKKSKRLYVLLPLLVLALCGLCVDRWARNKVEQAQAKLKAVNADEEKLTAEDVHVLLGRKPDRPIAYEGSMHVEQYSWVSGLPWRSFHIHVVYSPGETQYYQKAFANLDVQNLGPGDD